MVGSSSKKDQWTKFSEPGRFPLVLDPIVAGSKLTKVLIDGGSRLNVIFAKTLRKMYLDVMDMLTPIDSPFYGIVPGNAAIPLGQVVLPVTFGTKEHYRTEYIRFEVADFETCYHAILGGGLEVLGTMTLDYKVLGGLSGIHPRPTSRPCAAH